MPYIKPELRQKVDDLVDALCTIMRHSELEDTPGMMNYIISRIVTTDIRYNKCYLTINEAMGVLACVQQELYRRLAGPYEDQKCEQNGDVFDADIHE